MHILSDKKVLHCADIEPIVISEMGYLANSFAYDDRPICSSMILFMESGKRMKLRLRMRKLFCLVISLSQSLA